MCGLIGECYEQRLVAITGTPSLDALLTSWFSLVTFDLPDSI
jgi:hypothetical protein